MKAQRGKIIVLCLCLIFAMLIISGKATKLGTSCMSDATIRILKNSLQKLFRQGLSLMTDTRGEMFVIILNAG